MVSERRLYWLTVISAFLVGALAYALVSLPTAPTTVALGLAVIIAGGLFWEVIDRQTQRKSWEAKQRADEFKRIYDDLSVRIDQLDQPQRFGDGM